MKVLLLVQWFDPEPTFKGLAFAKALRARGHEVQVLTGFPNYPGGKLYPGYRVRLLQREMVEGIPVVRVALYPSHDRSTLNRMANYASFALSAALLGPLFTTQADVVYVYHPPATVALPAMVLRLLKGTPYVYDIGDMWPDSLGATGMMGSRVLGALIGAWCRLAYRGAAWVVATSPGFIPLLISRGVAPGKVRLIYNWCDEFQIHPGEPDPGVRKALGFEGRFNILFSGNMGKAQALDAVLDAAALTFLRVPEAQFVFIGGGIEVDRLKRDAAGRGLANVLFLPRRPYSEIGEVLSAADVLLVHLRDEPLFRITTPSKIQAYFFIGRPVVAAVRGDAAQLVLQAGAGLACAPESPEAICDAVERLHRMPATEREAMGRRGRDFYMRELSMAAGTAHFESLFETAAAESR